MNALYDAIVIGSGFGGAVAACRLAQAGLKVCILERGRRYASGFPRDFTKLQGWSYRHGQGLFDVKPLSSKLFAVQTAGYGGGSLVYANVIMRAPADLFAEGFPTGITREALDPYYDLVCRMLDVKPISPQQPKGLPKKTLLLRKSAAELGRAAQVFHPNLAVDFSAPDGEHRNRFGVLQRGCTHCGECDIGCNQRAKNTLDFNYLALAEQHHAVVKTRCEVQNIKPQDGGYRVRFHDHESGSSDSLDARHVFLCAGSINSTELLLRCRDVERTLPGLSQRLGHNYSGNGDFLGMAFDAKPAIEPANGPTITTAVLYDRVEDGRRIWFLTEDGGASRDIARFADLINPRLARLKAAPHLLWDDLKRELRTAAHMHAQVASTDAPSDHNGLFLIMGRDRANGRLHLDPASGELQLDWDVPSNLPLYLREEQVLKDLCETLDATMVANPIWSRLHQPAATHNLGGCPMADSPEHGVTSPLGEVYGHPNLYVLDGAILPAAIGANPSATIAALAERNIEAIIRRLRSDGSWHAPEKSATAASIPEPLDSVLAAARDTPPPRSRLHGLHFTETMRGHIELSHQPVDDYLGAEQAGTRAGARAEFTLTIEIPELDAFLADPNMTAMATGTVQVAGLTAPEGAPVRDGVWNAFVPAEDPRARRMLYALPFHGADGRPYLLDGYKDVRDHGGFDVWAATTTLYTVIRAGHTRSGAVVATGIIRISQPDFLKQLSTFRATGTSSPLESSELIARFGKAFLGSLYDVYVKAKLPSLTPLF